MVGILREWWRAKETCVMEMIFRAVNPKRPVVASARRTDMRQIKLNSGIGRASVTEREETSSFGVKIALPILV
jgi:hypothetical protein